MSTPAHDTRDGNGLKDFDAAWRDTDEKLRTLIRVVYGLIGLTRLGEHPVEVDRVAAYLELPVDEAVALIEEHTGTLFTARIRDGLVTLDLSRPESLRRRHIRIGDRRIAMSGCAPDLFQIAAVIDTPFRVEDTCPTTGVPIRVDFTPPDRIDAVDPADTVVALDPRLIGQASTMTPEQIDANLCVQMPLFANADAARGWLAAHPARRVCPVRQVSRLEVVGYVRDVIRPLVAARMING
jgi:alkylmercury lyase